MFNQCYDCYAVLSSTYTPTLQKGIALIMPSIAIKYTRLIYSKTIPDDRNVNVSYKTKIWMQQMKTTSETCNVQYNTQEDATCNITLNIHTRGATPVPHLVA